MSALHPLPQFSQNPPFRSGNLYLCHPQQICRLRLGKGTCYVSEAIAKPFGSWSYGLPDKDL